jgi:hypothetical protein
LSDAAHMTTTFEQPKHLNLVTYRRVVRIFAPMFTIYGIFLSGMLIFSLWRRAEAGEQVATWRWMAAIGVGFLIPGSLRLNLLYEKSRRRYVEFRGERLFLAKHGVIAIRRFVTWSLSADPIDPRYTRLQLIYRCGFGERRWTMLLDDDSQISKLRYLLTSQLPQKIVD